MRDERGKLRVDGVGIALIAVGSAALEILLDRGQIDDWFGSSFIAWMFAIAVLCLGAAVFWELRQPDPVIEFRLLGSRNFAIANVLLLCLRIRPVRLHHHDSADSADLSMDIAPSTPDWCWGRAPSSLRCWRRWAHSWCSAESSSRGILLTVAVVGGRRCHSSITAISLWQTDYAHYAWARALQGLGYAFFFVPLSVIAYSQLQPSQNNKASSITNFFRNWGGSFGIAFVTTMAERRQNFHQSAVGANLPPSVPGLQSWVDQTAAYLQAHGFSHADAINAAYARVYHQLQAQTQLLAFMDVFHVIGLITLIAAPLVLLTAAFRMGGGSGAAH